MSKLLSNWTEVGGTNSGVIRQNTTGRQGEIRTVFLDPIYSPTDQELIYNYRRDTSVPFVNVYGSELTEIDRRTSEKSKPEPAITAITERIPFRLVDCPQLTFPETLYTLDRSLQGFDVAYQKCGPMRVNDQMIGFNNEGQCKVWVNQDFGNNHPSHPRRRLISTKNNSRDFLQGKIWNSTGSDQSDMVRQIVDTVQDYCQEGRYPQPFATRIHQPNLSFSGARGIIHDTIREGRIPVANRVDLFNNKVWLRTTKTTTTTNVMNTTTNVNNAALQQQYQTTLQEQYRTTTNTRTVQPVQSYMFNYLPVPAHRSFEPDIFASRVGEHGIYKGHAY